MKILFFILCCSFIFSIGDSELINSIIIHGNKKTKDYIIQRELLHPLNTPLDSLIMLEDINRLYNLGIFSKVDIYKDKNIYHINLVESISLLPLPLIEYDEPKNEWTLGIAIADINFLGQNQKLFAGGTFIGDEMYNIGLYNPWVFGDHVSFTALIYNRYSKNIFYDFNFYDKRSLLEIGFYRGLHNKFKLNIGYYKNNIEESSISNEYYDMVINKSLSYKYFSTGFNYRFDTRNIYIDPSNGLFIELNGNYYKGLNQADDIYSISTTFKQYFSLKINYLDDPVFSYKVHALLKYPDYNKLPIFSYEYLGGGDYVKGYSSIPNESPEDIQDLIENSNILCSSFEFQSTILKRKNYNQSDNSIEFGVDGFLFIDIGVGSKKYSQFNLKENLVGYGFGVKFFITGPGVITLAFGFNPYGQYHLHISD